MMIEAECVQRLVDDEAELHTKAPLLVSFTTTVRLRRRSRVVLRLEL